MYRFQDLEIFSGSSNTDLAKDVSSYVNSPLSEVDIKRFADGEIFIRIEKNIRGKDCFIIQSTSPNVNENLMELLIMVDALKRASAGRITAVIPYYGYARQDRKDRPRVPITAKLIADLLTVAGVNRVLTMDLHVDQIQGFFNIPVDHLYAAPIFVNNYLNTFDFDLFVAPDIGGVGRTRGIARRMGKEIAIIDKRRMIMNQSEVMNIIGDVEGKSLVLYDDILDTGGTIINAANALIEEGAKEVRVICVHGLFSNNAHERFEKSSLKEIAVTNTISQKRNDEKFRVFSIAPILGEAIMRIHNNSSVSSLFI